jgi:hypothetical protein
MFQTNTTYLHKTHDIKSTTIDQYISHCKTTLSERSWRGVNYIRFRLLIKALTGRHREDIRRSFLRLISSIPSACAAMAAIFQVAADYY